MDYCGCCFDPVLKKFVQKIAAWQLFLCPRAMVFSEDRSLFVQLQGDMRSEHKTKLRKYGDTLVEQPALDR